MLHEAVYFILKEQRIQRSVALLLIGPYQYPFLYNDYLLYYLYNKYGDDSNVYSNRATI